MMTAARLLGLVLLLAAPAVAREARPDLDAERIRAHEAFLAGPELRGRESSTRDEAIAAAYVAAQFRTYGLQPAPGMTGYLQRVSIVAERPVGEAVLTVGGEVVPGARLLSGAGGTVGGKAAVLAKGAPAPKADAVVVTDPATPQREITAAVANGATLVIVPESPATQRRFEANGGGARLPARPCRCPASSPISSSRWWVNRTPSCPGTR